MRRFFLIFLALLGGISPAFPVEISANSPDFSYVIADGIAPFFTEGTDFEHYSRIPYETLDTDTPPYVHTDRLAAAKKRWSEYAALMAREGYTHLSLDDVVHVITLDALDIYSPDSIVRQRNEYYISYFRELIDIAHAHGLGVFLTSDLPFLTEEIRDYVGDIDPQDDRLFAVMRAGMDEVLARFPDIAGVIVRTGEGGGSYDTPSGYASDIVYTSAASIRRLLQELLPTFEQHERLLVFRTWSIGFGEAGDLVANPETYDRVFSGIDSRALIVSIKISPGDFFRFPQQNQTIGHGNIPQIVELQNRREYEGGGDFPASVLSYHRDALEFLHTRDTVIGVWTWQQQGGWGFWERIFGNFGLNFWNEINFFITAELLRNPDLSDEGIISHVLDRYDLDSGAREVLQSIIKWSERVIERGWYIDEFRRQYLTITRTRVPPLLWIWWDRAVGSPFVLAFIAHFIHDPDQVIAEGKQALQTVRADREAWERVMDESSEFDGDIRQSLENREYVFEILSVYREFFFAFFRDADASLRDELVRLLDRYDAWAREYAGDSLRFDTAEIRDAVAYIDSRDRHALYSGVILLLLSGYVVLLFRMGKNGNYLRLVAWYALAGVVLLILPPLFFTHSDFSVFFIQFAVLLHILFSLYTLLFSEIARRLFGVRNEWDRLRLLFSETLATSFVPIAVFAGVVAVAMIFGDHLLWRTFAAVVASDYTTLSLASLGLGYLLVSGGVIAGTVATYRDIASGAFFRFALFHLGFLAFFVMLFLAGTIPFFFFEIADILFPTYFFEAGSDIRHIFSG